MITMCCTVFPPHLQSHDVEIDQGNEAEIEEEPEKDDNVQLDGVQ